MGNSRVPDTVVLFDTYINNTDNYLQTTPAGAASNWQRLGLSAGNLSDWTAKRVHWRDELFPKYTNPLTSTSAVKKQTAKFMVDFRKFASPLLNIMAAQPEANTSDAVVLNFKLKRAKPTRHNTPIVERVVFDAKQLGGGELKFTCRTAHDANRPSKAKWADSVMLACQIHEYNLKDLPNPDDMPHEIFTKASFIKYAGVTNVGKALVVYARWYNTRHPALAGPWGIAKIFVIA